MNGKIEKDINIWRIIPGEPEDRKSILCDFLVDDIIAVGYNEVGDLRVLGKSDEVEKEDLFKFVAERLKEAKDEEGEYSYGAIDKAKTVFRYFYKEMKINDIVIVYAEGYIFAIGIIVGDYEYEKVEKASECNFTYSHRRKVKWILKKKISTTELPNEIKRKLEHRHTIVKLDSADLPAIFVHIFTK